MYLIRNGIKNKRVAQEAPLSVSLMFFPHFDIPCDLLLYRPTITRIYLFYMIKSTFSTHLSIQTNTAFLAHLSSKLKHRSNGLKMQTNSWETRKTINRIGMKEAKGLLELFLGQRGENVAQSCSFVTLNFTGEVTRGKSPFFMWSTIYQ